MNSYDLRQGVVCPLLVLLISCFSEVNAEEANDAKLGPRSGDLYREYHWHAAGDKQWRITDGLATEKFEAARSHLPNATLPLVIDDLEHAIRAELQLDRWGGHRGTINKRVRFNGGQWITIPEISTASKSIRPEQLMFQDNPIVAVPLADLHEGANVFEGDCDESGGFGWGQWGLYAATLRVYFDPSQKGERGLGGRITSPANGQTIGEDPVVAVEAGAKMGVSRVDVLAAYEGFDTDGDGDFGGYHGATFQLVDGQPAVLRHHVGTIERMPYRLVWNTRWVPDQPAHSIALVARICDSRGYWRVTEPVTGLSLDRPHVAVKMYRPIGVPEDFSVRVGETKSCTFEIPKEVELSRARDAVMHLRTWHGWDAHHDPIRVNEYELPIGGNNHRYDDDLLQIPTEQLVAGTNQFAISSSTEHHMLEVLWPGPTLAVRFDVPERQESAGDVEIKTTQYEGRPHYRVATPAATYFVDANSGGLSRMIDSEGRDWIGFKREPWDQYPSSAASAFRGMPNLLFGDKESGFGHPGFDRGMTALTGSVQLTAVSESGNWKIVYDFDAAGVMINIKTKVDQPYWFLYEGPPAGRFAPERQGFVSDQGVSERAYDYVKGDRKGGRWSFVEVVDRDANRKLRIEHVTADQADDQYSHLGNARSGNESPDGMVVVGFGRGLEGIDPQLVGDHRFRVELVETSSSALSP
ncbi:MAG: hypothetical protein AAF664_04400 [Planctomycetota bacterium]